MPGDRVVFGLRRIYNRFLVDDRGKGVFGFDTFFKLRWEIVDQGGMMIGINQTTGRIVFYTWPSLFHAWLRIQHDRHGKWPPTPARIERRKQMEE